VKTIGIVEVARFAVSAGAPPATATITATFRKIPRQGDRVPPSKNQPRGCWMIREQPSIDHRGAEFW
jgi:hypothetical protein